jgi:Protein of unknown function (DUF2637)
MTGERLRRASMWALASGVAAIAAIVSYSHIYDLGRAHGGTGVAARLLPLSVDMLILVGELMLLHESDSRDSRFWLGWGLVWSGILATLAANVTYGAQFSAEGAIIWGWPAYSFILVAAGMVAIAKRGGKPQADAVLPAVASSAETAALESLKATLAAGNPWSQNQLMTRFGLTRAEAAKVRQAVMPGANGQHPPETGEPHGE